MPTASELLQHMRNLCQHMRHFRDQTDMKHQSCTLQITTKGDYTSVQQRDQQQQHAEAMATKVHADRAGRRAAKSG